MNDAPKRRAWDTLVSPGMIIFILSSIFGGIVWGVQVNGWALDNRERIGRLEATQSDQAQMLQKTALLLDSLTERVREMKEAERVHMREAESWRQKILLNEQRINDAKSHFGGP